jgi:DNA end-binding protein Ku
MASPGRAYWKGFLRLSLVSIAVEIFNAVDSSTEIRFNQIHKPSGKRINYTKTVKGIGPIETSDIVKGYQVDENVYVFLEPEELDAIKLESKKTLDLMQFVDVKDIDPRYFERPYYLVPQDDQSAEGYLVIREALDKMNKMGVGQITMSGREYLVAVGTVDRGLVMEIMRYPNELKAPQTYFHDLPNLKVDADMVSLATEIIKRKSGAFKPEEFKDRYAVALSDLVKKKSKGRRIVAAPDEGVPSQGNVINLMDALRKSLKSADKQAEPKSASPKKKARAK